MKHAQSEASAPERFTATLRIDDRIGGKRFQGVWLHTGGDKLLVDYRAHPWWTSFDEHEVLVTGEHWSPDPNAQQIMASHFRVSTLEVVDPAAKPVPHYIKLGAPQTLTGVFEQERGEPGTKLADEIWTVFVADGNRYGLAQLPQDAPEYGAEAQVRVRIATPSPFVARRGADQLWLLDIETIPPS